MRKNPDQPVNRREFFRTALRGAVTAAIGGAGAYLGFRRADAALTGQTCVNRSICSSCEAFDACGLPAALSAKQANGVSGVAGVPPASGEGILPSHEE